MTNKHSRRGSRRLDSSPDEAGEFLTGYSGRVIEAHVYLIGDTKPLYQVRLVNAKTGKVVGRQTFPHQFYGLAKDFARHAAY